MKTFSALCLNPTIGNDKQSWKNCKNVRWLHPDVSTWNFCAGSPGQAGKISDKKLKTPSIGGQSGGNE